MLDGEEQDGEGGVTFTESRSRDRPVFPPGDSFRWDKREETATKVDRRMVVTQQKKGEFVGRRSLVKTFDD